MTQKRRQFIEEAIREKLEREAGFFKGEIK
jgi:hypothetical protein